jgi:two-component system response regulator HydG
VTARALIVDDDDGIRYTLRGVLEEAGVEVFEAVDGVAALAELERSEVQLVISDLRMPRMTGSELLVEMRRRRLGARVILLTAHGSERFAVEAMKNGAYDYFRKPFELDELRAAIRRALESVELEAENERLSAELNLSRSLVFASAAMSRLALLIQRVGPRDVTVLITGESGTGKERVAEALVRASARAARPFVRFNCAALTPELAEAELFGHAKGAFTGAHRARPGLFREADGGTLLLDEIAELDPQSQAKLLRVLQEREVRPIGEDRAAAIDVRILAATHRDLSERVRAGRFREDLYYRLKVVTLELPALRNRTDDIPVLVRHFLGRHAARFGLPAPALDDAAMARLGRYRWPGNVRELENCIESLVVLSDGGVADLAALPETAEAPPVEATAPLKSRVDAYERGLILAALSAAGDNRSEAARLLGISRATLHDKLRKHGIARDE